MERKIYIQVLSVISCIAVIMLHTNGCFWAFSTNRYWLTANIIESVMYFAVPIFFMITGATLIDYSSKYDTKTYFKKRFLKTVIPFIIWSIISMLAYYLSENEFENFSIMITKLLRTEYLGIYWFFPALFSVYLAIPVLSKISQRDSGDDLRKNTFKYAIIVGFIVNSLLPFVLAFFNISYSSDFIMPAVVGYTLYALIGYYIDNYEISKKLRYCIYTASMVGLLIHLIGTYILSINAGQIIGTFKGYLNVPCILYSTGIFTFAKYFKNEKILSIANKITKPFSSQTFGIYLTHYYIIIAITSNGLVSPTSIIYRVFGAFAIFLICSLLIKLIQKIPILKYCVPG